MGPIKANPEKQYVAGGYGFLQRNIPQVLPWMVDDITRDFGPEVYDAMHTDAMVGSTFRLWKMQVLANDVQLMAAVQPSPDRLSPLARETWTPDEVLAQEILEFCQRSTDRCQTPIKTVFSEMLDCARLGNKMAEKLHEPGEAGGPDAGRIILKDIKVKPRWSWLFVADVFLDLVGILCFDPQVGGFVIIPRDKFMITTWQMENNDPRGTSLYRQAYRPWNFKQSLYPEYYKGLSQFGTPSIVGFTPPEAESDEYPQIDDKGKEIPNAPKVTAQTAQVQALQAWRNGCVVSFPADAKVQVEWPQGNGEPFLKGFDWLDRQIVYGILGSTRDTMEAEHGSKADSEISQDKVGNQIKTGREMIETAYRNDVLKPLVVANWNKDIAERFTPTVSLGDVEHQDIAALMIAISGLLKSGGIDRESQMPAINVMLDLPPAAPGAYAKMAENEQAAKMKSAAEPGADGDGKDEESKPPAKKGKAA